MRIIGVGNLVTDYYYKDYNFLGACGGMTAFNIIANLSSKYETYAVGICGDDDDGRIAVQSLQNLNVNTEYVLATEKQTRCFNINIQENGISSKKRCPICNRKKWYETSEKKIELPKKIIIKNKTIVVFDTVNDENISLASISKKSGSINIIDIGQVGKLEDFDKDQFVNNIHNKFDLVQLNERVSDFLIKKFELKNTKELNKLFLAKLITITYGKKGVEFICNNKSYVYNLENPSNEIDSTGAGDLFFSVLIDKVIQNKFDINKRLLNKIYKEATLKTSELVKVIGARGLLEPLYKVKIKPGRCICGLELEEKEKGRKKIKKISSNVANLSKRIKSNFSSKAYENVKKLIDNLEENTIFSGTGGSYAPSYYASKVVNSTRGIFTEAYLPRDIIFKNLENIKNIIGFSYSGATNDVMEAFNYAKNQDKYLITKGKIKLENIKTISYLNSNSKTTSERGFLSIEGTVFPASLFAKYYYDIQKFEQSFEKFLDERLKYWRDYFTKYFKDNDIENILNERNILDIFYGDYTNTAAIDLESKIVETGIYRATFHEKKNFSHGRFISLEKYKSDAIIYLQTNDESKYEKKLMEYLNNKSNNMILIKTPFNNLIGEFDLLLAMQYFIKNIAEMLDIDLSKPSYSEDSMKIYKYKGNLK